MGGSGFIYAGKLCKRRNTFARIFKDAPSTRG